MVKLNVVATDKLPGSVAVTVTEKGEPAVVVGAPLMVLPDRLRPAGRPLAVKFRASPLGSEKEDAMFKLNAWPTVPVWLAIPVVVGLPLGAVTVTLTVPVIVWLGLVASVTVTVKVCTPADIPETVAVLPLFEIAPGPLKAYVYAYGVAPPDTTAEIVVVWVVSSCVGLAVSVSASVVVQAPGTG